LELAFLHHHVRNALTQMSMVSYIADAGKREHLLQDAAARVSEVLFRIANSADLTGLSLEVDLGGVELAHAGAEGVMALRLSLLQSYYRTTANSLYPDHPVKVEEIYVRSDPDRDHPNVRPRPVTIPIRGGYMANLKGLESMVSQLKEQRTNFVNQLRHVDAALAILGKLNGGHSYTKPRRTISAYGRKRIAAAPRARWAKVKRQKVVPIRSGKRTMSASARRKIAAAQRARWAKFRQGKRRPHEAAQFLSAQRNRL
jgi:hypothetical protein